MTPATVFVVDDDDALRDALCQLIRGDGLKVESYRDGESFLAAYGEDRPGCLLLDMAMPGMDGLQVQQALRLRGQEIPIVFLTGHGDIPMAVRATQAGALDFLEKPVEGVKLLDRVHRALAQDQESCALREGIRTVQQHYAHLTPREREVMAMVVAGLSNKAIAIKLGLSYRTVEVHRTHVMHKMGAANLAELVNLAALCMG